jgi:hypothetical protein
MKGLEMTKEEARQFRDRWNLVKQARFEEVRQMSPERKLRDVEMLFEFGETLGWGNPAGADGWEYWRKLKELSHVQR